MKNLQKETWELKTLVEIATDIYTGNGVTQAQLNSGNCPAVKNEDISSKLEQQFKECVNFVNPELIKNPKCFQKGDLLISNMGGEKTIGKTCVYLGEAKCIAGNHVIVVKHNQNPKYLAYSMSTSFYKKQVLSISQKSTVWDLYISKFKQIKIPIPSLNIQSQIANYLDKFSELIEELKTTLNESRKQYSYYLNSLIGRSEEEVRKKNWEIKSLVEIATDIYRGIEVTQEQLGTGNYPAIKCRDVNSGLPIQFKKCVSFVNPDLISRKKYFEHGDILIGKIGNVNTSGTAVVYLGHEKCILGDSVYCLKHNQNPKYLVYALSGEFIRNQVKILCKQGIVFNFFLREIKQLKIPLPPLEEQERIVSILDKFHTICGDIEKGIPALIKDVTKQYEYYRDQIFS